MSNLTSIKKELQYRRAESDTPPTFGDATVEGYAIVWGTVNDYLETCERGCCAESLKKRGLKGKEGNQIRFLLQHDSRQILGKLEELKEDDYGLFFRASIYQNLSYSRDAMELIKAGELRQLSYGFRYCFEEGDYELRADSVLLLKRIDLHEISLVTFSSDPAAQLRSRREDAREVFRALQADRERRAFGFGALASALYKDNA